MKCPKCGFVSFPGLDQCKKCGHRFTPVQNQQSAAPPLFRQPSTETAQPGAPLNPGEAQEQPVIPKGGSLNHLTGHGKSIAGPQEQGAAQNGVSNPTPSMDWQKELVGRMEEFRRRRARIYQGHQNEDKSLNLDFSSPASSQDQIEDRENVIEFPSFDEMNLRDDPSEGLDPDWDAISLDEAPQKSDGRDAPSSSTRHSRVESPASATPMEIEMDSSPRPAGVMGSDANGSPLKIAPMSKRFLAGIFDLAVLLSAAGLFGLIFWRAGGRLSLAPLSLAAATLMGVIFLMAYFGVFTVFAYGTPGLLWAGLEVRTFEGNFPRRVDCFWRAFGYLVSISALLLGFIWGVVDGEGLTWHDRMSRTVLVEAQDQESLGAATAGWYSQ